MHGNNSKRGSSNTMTSSIYVVLLEQELEKHSVPTSINLLDASLLLWDG